MDFCGYTVQLRIAYAIDFCNPAPDADLGSVGPDNFEWVVETASNYAIEVAETMKKEKIA
jgi:hypothetical protein